MELHLRAIGYHLPYGITVLPVTRHKWTHPDWTPLMTGWYLIYLSWKTWVVVGDWFHTEVVTHPTTNLAAHGGESKS